MTLTPVRTSTRLPLMPLPNGPPQTSPKPSKPVNARSHPKPPLPSVRPLPTAAPATSTLQRPRKSSLRRQSGVEPTTLASPAGGPAAPRPLNKRVSFGGEDVKVYSPPEKSPPEAEQPPSKSAKLSFFGTAGSSSGQISPRIHPKGSPIPKNRQHYDLFDSDSESENLDIVPRLNDGKDTNSSPEPSPDKEMFLPKKLPSPAKSSDGESSDSDTTMSKRPATGVQKPQAFSEELSPLPPVRLYNRPSELGGTFQVLQAELPGNNAADIAIREDFTLNLSEHEDLHDRNRRRSSLSSLGDGEDEPTLNMCDINKLCAEAENYPTVPGSSSDPQRSFVTSRKDAAHVVDEGDMTLPPFGPGSLLERHVQPSPDRKSSDEDITGTIGGGSSDGKSVIGMLLRDADTQEAIPQNRTSKATQQKSKNNPQPANKPNASPHRRHSAARSSQDSDNTIRNLFESTLLEDDPTLHWTPEEAKRTSLAANPSNSRVSLAPVMPEGIPRNVNGERADSERTPIAPAGSLVRKSPSNRRASIGPDRGGKVSLAPVNDDNVSLAHAIDKVSLGSVRDDSMSLNPARSSQATLSSTEDNRVTHGLGQLNDENRKPNSEIRDNMKRKSRMSLAPAADVRVKSPRMSLAPAGAVNMRRQNNESGEDSECSVPMSDNVSLMPANMRQSADLATKKRQLNEETSPEDADDQVGLSTPLSTRSAGLTDASPGTAQIPNVRNLLDDAQDESYEISQRHTSSSNRRRSIAGASPPSQSPQPSELLSRSPSISLSLQASKLVRPSASPSVSLSLQASKAAGPSMSDLPPVPPSRRKVPRKPLGPVEPEVLATPSMNMNASSGFATPNSIVREGIYTSVAFKNQLASRGIQFDVSEPSHSESAQGRNEGSESKSGKRVMREDLDEKGLEKMRYLDESRKKALLGLLQEQIKHLRTKLERSKMAVKRNEAELERTQPEILRRVCNPELSSSVDQATLLMVGLKRTRKVCNYEAHRKWYDTRREMEQGFIDNLRQTKMELRRDVSKVRQATAKLKKESEEIHQSGAIDKDFIETELRNSRVDSTRDYLVQLLAAHDDRRMEVDSQLMEERDKKREHERLKAEYKKLGHAIDYWKVFEDADSIEKLRKVEADQEEANRIVSSSSGIWMKEQGSKHFSVTLAGMLDVDFSVNRKHLINAKCSTTRVTKNEESVWQKYVNCVTDIAIDVSKIRQNEYTCNIPATLQAASGFLLRARYALEQLEEFERLNQGKLLYAGVVTQEQELSESEMGQDENLSPKENEHRESQCWSPTAVQVVIKAPFFCLKRRSKFDVVASHVVRALPEEDPYLTRTEQRLRVDKITRYFGDAPTDEEIRTLVEGDSHQPTRVVSLNNGLSSLWAVLQDE